MSARQLLRVALLFTDGWLDFRELSLKSRVSVYRQAEAQKRLMVCEWYVNVQV